MPHEKITEGLKQLCTPQVTPLNKVRELEATYTPDSPVVFTVLMLVSCNNCSGEQDPTAQHTCQIGQYSFHSSTMYTLKLKLK